MVTRINRIQSVHNFQIKKVAVNILNRQSQTADKRMCSSFGVGFGATIVNGKKLLCYESYLGGKFFCNPILLAICTSTLPNCVKPYTMACRRVLRMFKASCGEVKYKYVAV
jgi:hypothetical protein